jgi:hypothetical protein
MVLRRLGFGNDIPKAILIARCWAGITGLRQVELLLQEALVAAGERLIL